MPPDKILLNMLNLPFKEDANLAFARYGDYLECADSSFAIDEFDYFVLATRNTDQELPCLNQQALFLLVRHSNIITRLILR